MNYFFSILIGFALGSFPTAYVLLKKKGIDITKAGSKNVGTLNSYEVTNSKVIGISVLLIDFIKGMLSVLIIKYLLGYVFILQIISLSFAVLGHCYSPWIKFKGGKGLATAAGGSAVLMPVILGLWILFWIAIYLYKKNIQIANTFASLLVGLLAVSTQNILNKFSFPPAKNPGIFAFGVSFMLLIIISKHIIPLKEYFEEQKSKIRTK